MFSPFPWDYPELCWWGWPAEEEAMSETQASEAGQLFTLATKTKPQREPHLFGPGLYCEATSGRARQREWACPKCSLVKITVLSAPLPHSPRRYRWGEGMQFEADRDPECVLTLAFAGKAAE
jgi:hypothetical protein